MIKLYPLTTLFKAKKTMALNKVLIRTVFKV